MFRVKSLMGAVGVMLFLIALYLVLVNATGAGRIIAAWFSGGSQLARTLQGR